MMTRPLVLIPAAGFGTRVGSPPAKELFLDPSGSPLIAFGLDQARARGWPVHVITRKEKTSLIQYLESYRQQWKLELEIQIIEPSQEWPDTLLQSEPFWHEKNLLCLPDTVFEPVEIWDDLARSNADIAAALFEPSDKSKWGVFRFGLGILEVCEKPRDVNATAELLSSKPSKISGNPVQPNVFGIEKAWGLLSWNKTVGKQLFHAQLKSSQDHEWKALNCTFEEFSLISFEDVTRGPKA